MVKKGIGQVAYELELPTSRRIHPVFHIRKLRTYVVDDDFPKGEQPLPPNWIDNHFQYQVQKLLDHILNKKNGCREFLIRLQGYDALRDSWEPVEHSRNCDA